MLFVNRIRLPFYLSKPQYPVDEDIYLKANGTRRVLKSIVSKELEGRTDWLPQKIHERLAIALRHDTVSVEGEKFSGDVRINGAYEIDWPDFLDFPLAPARFRAFEEAFAARNTRCDVCSDDVLQMTLRDDTFPQAIDEGDSEIIFVAENDSICCTNPVFSIYSYNSTYVDTVVINSATGEAQMTLKTGIPSSGTIQLFQYKVQCGEQEAIATVFGAVNGTATPPCPPPSDLVLTIVDPASNPVELNASWSASIPAPADGYGWMLTSDDGTTETVIGSGTTTGLSVTVNSLPYNTLLRFRVWAICDEDTNDVSVTILDTITTPDEPDCGDAHLSIGNYTVSDVQITLAPCTVDVTVTRNQLAIDDAVCNNQCVSVIVRLEADNGCVIFEGVDFDPSDDEATLTNIDLSCGLTPCTAINASSVVNVLEISC